MIITVPGKDMISVNDGDISDEDLENWNVNVFDKKVHLIKIQVTEPTEQKMDFILDKYPYTNRFIINDNIRFYNWFFRSYEKKYYVENGYNVKLISFFKKNNKVLLNFNKLDYDTKKFAMKAGTFKDILRNLEILQLSEEDFAKRKSLLLNWNGNVIVE